VSEAAKASSRLTTRRIVDHVLIALLVGAAAAALVWLRIRLIPVPAPTRIAALVAIYTAILAACLLVPSPRRAGRPLLALGVGVLGVGVATAAAGTPAAFPSSNLALPLSILGAFAEEALFRRTLYDALEPRGAAAAIIISALLFAVIHIPLYGAPAFPVDLGAGLLFGWQRWAAGTWRVSAATHAVANVIAILR
jgi:membrane protease YdiL (CAAX protease family)